MIWTVFAINLFVGLEAGGVLAYSAFTRPPSVHVGRPPVDAVAVAKPQPAEAPQPVPVAVDIPRIGVHSRLVDLNVDEAGVLDGPEDFAVAGWWAGGPVPGAVGAAVLVGHVDSYKGPAVFIRVRELKPGDRIDVGRLGGSTVSFTVDAVQQYRKDEFPTARVYGPTTGPELRLITCGGEFDRRTKSYRDNVVVYAHRKPNSAQGRTS